MLGERLKQARMVSGMSTRALAERAGISAQAISKYERNMDTPSSGVLIRLSKALNVKTEYFFRDRTVNLSVVSFRKRASLPRKEENAVLGSMKEWLERYLDVEDLFPNGQGRPFQLPEIDVHVKKLEDAEAIAEELRKAWDLGLDPIVNLMELFEEKGIKVYLVDADQDFDACTFVTDDGAPVVAIKSGLPGDRQRFNLAHELAHNLLKIDDGIDAEKVCHRFAGAFLVPKPAAYLELGQKRSNLSEYELLLLKYKYGLSMQAWIYRSKDLGIISETVATHLFRRFRSRGWHIKEPGKQLQAETPERIERLVMRAVAEDAISHTRAAELLGKPLRQFCQEVSAQNDGFTVDLCN
jgi:Zn-dependent peptidase ImmA (M78 family)/DNA-binding XRE family transcriptional regulator